MTTTILLIRHGETAWNRDKIFRGIHDVPLNDNGRIQAELAAAALRRRTIDAAYTSPLSRARETAEIVLAEHDRQAVIEPGLVDLDYGDWTGKPEADVARQWPAEFDTWITHPEQAEIPNGDTLAVAFDRNFTAMERIAAQHPDQTVALFAHRVVNKLLVLAALGLDLDRFSFIRQDNCCLNEFERTGAGYIIRTLNNTTHIDKTATDLLQADF